MNASLLPFRASSFDASSSSRAARPSRPAFATATCVRIFHWRRIARACLVVAAVASLAGVARPQPAPPASVGTVEGRVLNVDSGSYLNNARVRVVGTSSETFTNSFGEYRLTGIPAGEKNLQVFYTGLAAQTLTVVVPAGGVVRQNVELARTGRTEDGTVQLDEFVVATQREYNAHAIAINEQRFSANLKNVVSTDAFGEINQGNIGELLKYVPGVTLELKDGNNPSGIQVRGFTSNYTNVTLDGGQLASAALANTQAHTRQFVLEQANINNLSRIEVYKLPLPEHSANTLGGSVNLVSKSAFEYARPELRFSAYLSANSKELEFDKTAGPGEDESYKILPSFDATYVRPISDRLGVVVNVAQSSQTYLQNQSVPGRRWTSNGATLDNPYTNSLSYRRSPNRTDRTSGSIKLDFRPWDHHLFEFTAQANAFKQQQATRSITYNTGGTTPVAWGETFTTGAASGGSTSIGGSYQGRHGLTRALGGKYTFTGSHWEIDVGALFSHSNNRVRDADKGFWNQFSTSLRDIGGVSYEGINNTDGGADSIVVRNSSGAVIDQTKLANYNLNRVTSQPMDAEDTMTDFRINVSRELEFMPVPFTVKFGGSTVLREREIDYHITEYNYAGPDGVLRTGDEDMGRFVDPTSVGSSPGYGHPGVEWASPWLIYDTFLDHPTWFIPHEVNNSINRNAERSPLVEERISSLYVQADTRLLNNRLRLVGGVRFELTEAEGWGPLTPPSGPKIYRGFFNSRDYHDYFPSLHATFNITDSLVFRAAFAQTTGRPAIVDIVPNLSAVEDLSIPEGGRVTASNPDLQPWTADNYDLSLEYYLPKNGVLSVGVFRKDLQNFFATETSIIDQQFLDDLGLPQDALGWRYTTKFNLPDPARITGIEINARQPLDFLGPWGERFELMGSFMKLDLDASSRDVQDAFTDFIPKSVSAGLRFGFWRINGNLLWNHRGKQLREVVDDFGTDAAGNDIAGEYIRARDQIDANLEYQLSRRFVLFVAVRNLTDETNEWEISGPGAPAWSFLTSHQTFGAQYSFGVKGTF
ncbi:MAG TPA: TonB-dependent receptor [Opitutaceae bacterium]